MAAPLIPYTHMLSVIRTMDFSFVGEDVPITLEDATGSELPNETSGLLIASKGKLMFTFLDYDGTDPGVVYTLSSAAGLLQINGSQLVRAFRLYGQDTIGYTGAVIYCMGDTGTQSFITLTPGISVL